MGGRLDVCIEDWTLKKLCNLNANITLPLKLVPSGEDKNLMQNNGENVGENIENQEEVERRMAEQQSARKALAYMPQYDGSTPWRIFEDRFKLWSQMNLDNAIDVNFRKRALLYAMKGNAADKARIYKEGSTQWDNSPNIEAYLTAMRNIFMPTEESEIARAEFKATKQKKNEDIASYLTMKISLWENAFPETERSFHTLLSEVIAGVYNPVVKRIIRRANPADQTSLRTVAITAVANERESYRGGYGESTSLDGLACVSISRQVDEEYEPMEVDRINKVEVQCYKCKKMGHISRNCTSNKPKEGEQPRRPKMRCFRCNLVGHVAAKGRVDLSKNPGREDKKQNVKAFDEKPSEKLDIATNVDDKDVEEQIR